MSTIKLNKCSISKRNVKVVFEKRTKCLRSAANYVFSLTTVERCTGSFLILQSQITIQFLYYLRLFYLTKISAKNIVICAWCITHCACTSILGEINQWQGTKGHCLMHCLMHLLMHCIMLCLVHWLVHCLMQCLMHCCVYCLHGALPDALSGALLDALPDALPCSLPDALSVYDALQCSLPDAMSVSDTLLCSLPARL